MNSPSRLTRGELPQKKRFTGEQPRASAEMVREKCLALRNWGRWGPDDELGTLNHVTADDVIAASRLVRRGKVFSLALPFDDKGPAYGRRGRFNPIHYMIVTGTDCYAGNLDNYGARYADDGVIMPLQCGTQWDALSHFFDGNHMWNGFDIRLVDSFGAKKNGIEKTKDKLVGRGVLLDVARAHDVETLPDGYAISAEELDYVAELQGVSIGRADFVIVRTGQMGARLRSGVWGKFSAGDAPGLALDTADWIQAKELAAVCSDTYGVEARPNPTDNIMQPWHLIVLPNMGLTMGEIFFLEELAADCAADRVYEFFFSGPSLPITGGVGSPTNPIAIK